RCATGNFRTSRSFPFRPGGVEGICGFCAGTIVAAPAHDVHRRRNHTDHTKCSRAWGVRPLDLPAARADTGEIFVNGPSSYDVCVIPHWDAGSSVIDGFERPSVAICRHADLVSHFRQDGWVRISEAGTDNFRTA